MRAGTWKLEDAKARFSEVVRRARSEGPQRVTLRGKPAVVVIDAATYDQDRLRRTGQHIVAALAASPPGELMLDRPFVTGPVRDVEL